MTLQTGDKSSSTWEFAPTSNNFTDFLYWYIEHYPKKPIESLEASTGKREFILNIPVLVRLGSTTIRRIRINFEEDFQFKNETEIYFMMNS